MIKHLNKKTFNQIMSNGKTSLIMFFSNHCPACSMMKPIFLDASKSNAKLFFGSINVETQDGDEIASALKIRGIPTIVIFQGSRESGRIVGAMDPTSFTKKISIY